jgi:hypothetical protein
MVSRSHPCPSLARPSACPVHIHLHTLPPLIAPAGIVASSARGRMQEQEEAANARHALSRPTSKTPLRLAERAFHPSFRAASKSKSCDASADNVLAREWSAYECPVKCSASLSAARIPSFLSPSRTAPRTHERHSGKVKASDATAAPHRHARPTRLRTSRTPHPAPRVPRRRDAKSSAWGNTKEWTKEGAVPFLRWNVPRPTAVQRHRTGWSSSARRRGRAGYALR